MYKTVFLKNKKYVVMEEVGCYRRWQAILATDSLRKATEEVKRQFKNGHINCKIFQPKQMKVTVNFED